MQASWRDSAGFNQQSFDSLPSSLASQTQSITMKPSKLFITALLALGVFSTSLSAANLTEGMKEGNPGFKSMGPLTFGPDGILFVADAKSAAITAIATGDTKAASNAKALRIDSIDVKIAGLLGTSPDQILIDDMAVNPLSRKTYLAVSRGRGPEATPVLLRVGTNGELAVVPTDKVTFSKAQLPDAPADKIVGEGRRQKNARMESITDIAFLENRLLIAGLSNEEFASTFRAVDFPFQKVTPGSTVEIFHGAHGRFETRSPVRTFVPFNIGDEAHLLAAYTCTPLVQLPIKSLKGGAQVKGKTIAELGNRNRPIDMIVYQKEGKDYLLLANSSRGIMKIATDGIEKQDSIESKIGDKAGLPYETIEEWTGIAQLDRLDSSNAVVVRSSGEGDKKVINLESLSLP